MNIHRPSSFEIDEIVLLNKKSNCYKFNVKLITKTVPKKKKN